MIVKIKKLREDAVIPSYANPTDAGMDLTAVSKTINTNKEYVEYGTGIAMEIPQGYVGLIFPRSSVTNTGMVLGNSVGVIDPSYRGEIKFRFKMLHSGDRYSVGDRVGQILIIPFPRIILEAVDELTESDRGENGFGSSGA